jgi:cytochrome c oxidase cbb3-type subunit 1
MGGRHLIGGPVPAWIPSVALGAGVLVLFHHMIVYLNLSGIGGSCGVVMKLAKYGFYAYLLSGVIDALFSLRGFAVITQFTLFQEAQWQLALASFTLITFAALYYLVPRISGAVWPSSALVRGHYLATVLGFAVLIISLGVAGWLQGTTLNDSAVSFEAIAALYRPWLLVASAAQALLLVGNFALLVNFVRILFVKTSEAATSQFRQPTNMEAPSS